MLCIKVGFGYFNLHIKGVVKRGRGSTRVSMFYGLALLKPFQNACFFVFSLKTFFIRDNAMILQKETPNIYVNTLLSFKNGNKQFSS